MTHNVSSGTLNITIPYRSVCTLTVQAVSRIVGYFHAPAVFHIDNIYDIVFGVVLPLTTSRRQLVREVRRASHRAAANLGLQQQHQSTSSNSAVPTVMLITTSLVNVFLMTPFFIVQVVHHVILYSVWCDETWIKTLHIQRNSGLSDSSLSTLLFPFPPHPLEQSPPGCSIMC